MMLLVDYDRLFLNFSFPSLAVYLSGQIIRIWYCSLIQTSVACWYSRFSQGFSAIKLLRIFIKNLWSIRWPNSKPNKSDNFSFLVILRQQVPWLILVGCVEVFVDIRYFGRWGLSLDKFDKKHHNCKITC